VIKTVVVQELGLTKTPQQIVQCKKTGNLALTDFETLSVVDENLTRLSTLYGEAITTDNNGTRCYAHQPNNKKYPYCMCFDEDGNLLVVERITCRLIMLNGNGQYIRTILHGTSRKYRPCSISTAPDGTLWIAFRNDMFNQIKYT